MVLNDVTEFVRNGASIKQEKGCKGTPITRIETISNSRFNYDRLGYADIFDDKYQDYYLQDNDVLLSHINSEKYLGRSVVYKQRTDENIIHGMNLLCLRFLKNRYNPSYFCYYSQSDIARMYISRNTKKSVNQASITATAIKNMPIPTTSIEEQKNVVYHLDSVQSIIDLYNEQMKKLDELIKSRFVEMFGDPVSNSKRLAHITLRELSELITKGSSPSWQGFNYVDDETQTLFITSENVREGYLDITSPKYLEDSFNERQKKSILKTGDFLINIVGASIGRAAEYSLNRKANINQAVALVRLKKGIINNSYLSSYLNSERAFQMYDSMKSDTGRANLSLQDIGNLIILTPSIYLQKQYADFVTQVKKQKATVQKSIDKLETLKKSLMQDYFG